MKPCAEQSPRQPNSAANHRGRRDKVKLRAVIASDARQKYIVLECTVYVLYNMISIETNAHAPEDCEPLN